mmetsp:Transcript_16126/g.44685  ORF Transcript_16126/g.44685 Transcript_16126/m.44685 type:complete len:210 (-) Transcript_16126:58-687(-)
MTDFSLLAGLVGLAPGAVGGTCNSSIAHSAQPATTRTLCDKSHRPVVLRLALVLHCLRCRVERHDWGGSRSLTSIRPTSSSLEDIAVQKPTPIHFAHRILTPLSAPFHLHSKQLPTHCDCDLLDSICASRYTRSLATEIYPQSQKCNRKRDAPPYQRTRSCTRTLTWFIRNDRTFITQNETQWYCNEMERNQIKSNGTTWHGMTWTDHQ